MWKRLRTFLSIFFILFLSFRAESQNLVYSFVDPCTKAITNFSVPVQGGTTVFFLGQSRFFTASDVSNGTFGGWVNQVYSDYRKVSPCSVQSASVTRNQITAQVVGSVVSSVMGSIGASLSTSVASSNGSSGGDDNASKGKTQSEKKKNNNNGNTNNGNSNSSNSNSNNGGNTTSSTNSGSNQTNSNQTVSNGTGTNQGSTNNVPVGGSGNGGSLPTGQGGNQQGSTQGGNTSQQTTSQGQGVGSNSETAKSSQSGEVVGTTVMNVDVRNDKGGDNSSSGGGGGSSKKSSTAKQQRANPMIVSSDITSAQNLDKSFTGIINIGMSQSSLTGTSSWGVTSMVWFNFKQFAVNGRYTMIKFNNSGKLKFIHNLNLTGAYSFGNVFGFLGYSMILNAGKYGITGGNISGAITKTPDDKNLFISPSITAFYTKPLQVNKKLTISPEIYVISTPVVYSSVDKITVTDRYFSGFLGSGFDYQLSKRFKFNINYKANLSTNPEFPILSFFLIGSKINL